MGIAYPTYFYSPLLTLQTFSNLKRFKYAYIYFNNSLAEDFYTVSDVNSLVSQDAEEIVNEPKVRLNASIAILYESDDTGEVSQDIYEFNQLNFDDGLFDVSPNPESYRRYVLFKESLLGVGYAYQLCLWSYDDAAFTMAAYQISSSINADRFITWTE